jgi:hypothetical protein
VDKAVGIEAVFSGYDGGRTSFGSIVGRPVAFVDKAVGSVSRFYQDPTGPYVLHVNVQDIPTLRLAATGCLTCVKVNGNSISLADRREDFGKSFQLTTNSGERLAKRFIPVSELERDQALLKQHVSKLPVALRKNERVALLLKGTEFEPKNWRKPGKDVVKNANDPSRTSNANFGPSLWANRNAENLAYTSAQDRQRHADPETEPWTPASTSGSCTLASFDWPNGLPAAGASQSRTQLPNRNSRT